MTARPYMKWFPADWRADPRLRMCSLAARGLWADMIAYMHEGEPYGHLTIDGIAPDIRGLASLVGRPVGEVRKALTELEGKQVFSRTEAGVIFSRRMVRDDEKAQEGRKHAGNRWANREAAGKPNRSADGLPNRPPNGSANGDPNTYSPESRVQKEREDAASRPPAGASADQEKELFERGKQILGAKAGGVITKLKKHQGGVAKARAVIEMASTKQNPMEWVNRVLRGQTQEGFFEPDGAIV